MKEFSKKTIALIYLAILSFGLFLPFNQSLAQNTANYLTITPDKTNIEKNTKIKITALFPKTENRHSNTTINFFSNPELTGFNNKAHCTIGINEIWSCYVEFESSTEGIYTIYGIYNYFNSKKFKTEPIIIEVKGEPVPINTTTTKTPTETKYTLLAPLPNFTEIETQKNDTNNPCPFGNYLNIMIRIIIGICAVLAMIMIVAGGIEYMTSELISSKEAGKERILHAILGLVIALGAYTILNTLNPQLLNACLNDLPKATITISPEQELIVKARTGGANCTVITDSNSFCFPDKLKTTFTGNTTKPSPFNTLAAQASAICQLESNATPNMPIGRNPSQYLDKCSDNKPFSFGLFQINASAHRNNIKDSNGKLICQGAFIIPSGHGSSQGNPIEDVVSKNGKSYHSKWSCVTHEPEYTACQNFLINPINNIKYAATSSNLTRWKSWSTNSSCKF